jgi:hypothetical protein
MSMIIIVQGVNPNTAEILYMDSIDDGLTTNIADAGHFTSFEAAEQEAQRWNQAPASDRNNMIFTALALDPNWTDELKCNHSAAAAYITKHPERMACPFIYPAVNTTYTFATVFMYCDANPTEGTMWFRSADEALAAAIALNLSPRTSHAVAWNCTTKQPLSPQQRPAAGN